MSMLLSEEDRRAFILYCEQVVESEKGMIEASKNLNMPSVILDRMKKRMVAHAMVALDLASGESVSIGAGS